MGSRHSFVVFWLSHLLCCLTCCGIIWAVPYFDPTALLHNVLVPSDAAPGSIIYRLRASDSNFDYPLSFSAAKTVSIVTIETLNCSRLNSVCQANVILKRPLTIGQYYDFQVNVKNLKGASTYLNCSFRATNGTTPTAHIFPGAPTLLVVSELAHRNSELGSIKVRGNPAASAKPVLLELWADPQFGLHQHVENVKDAHGTILLLGQLDYEHKTMHHLSIVANDPWTDITKDTRNVASWPLLVAVTDEQDTPPVFTMAPPITNLNPKLKPGDLILRVRAEDGDRGNPRPIRYGLAADSDDIIQQYFSIDESTGELRLSRPLSGLLALVQPDQPIVVTVVAEEIRSSAAEVPSQMTSVRLALIPSLSSNASIHVFGMHSYTAIIEENSPSGTILALEQTEVIARPGHRLILQLANSNGTFSIEPNVIEGHSTFRILVDDPKLLDYEMWSSVSCWIEAREVGTNNTAHASLTVLLTDVNDNSPTFLSELYEANIAENSAPGTTILRVGAIDVDREPGNLIRYLKLTGPGSHLFDLNLVSGVITVSNAQPLDAEQEMVFHLIVEAADEDGNGKRATSQVVIHLIDVNDERPVFEKHLYEFVLDESNRQFSRPAFIRAIDRDATPPNNVVHYQLVNPVDNVVLNEHTGELQVTDMVTNRKGVLKARARAWDGGTPALFDDCHIHIYPWGVNQKSQRLVFIVAGDHPDLETVRRTLQSITGSSQVTINEIRALKDYEARDSDAIDVSGSGDSSSGARSIVVATVIPINGERRDFNNEQNNLRKGSIQWGNLLWMLLFLLLLAILAAAILILCCVCESCPLYVAPAKHRKCRGKVHSEGDQRHLVDTPPENDDMQSKSVQVAEWFGRREAWTSERADSVQEINKRSVAPDFAREQIYIREGNTDILRLVTRERPTTFVPNDGKDVIMQRFINQQSEQQAARVPVAFKEHELLEESLRQHNALLRQLLAERERDQKLETQSLPAGTQTDHDAETQTDPPYLYMNRRRKYYSDYEISDNTDEDENELSRAKARIKRRHSNKTKRTVKTPIIEEPEVTVDTEQLRRQQQSTIPSSKSSGGTIEKQVLQEIGASLDQTDKSSSDPKDRAQQANDKSSKLRSTSESDLRMDSNTTMINTEIRKRNVPRYMEWYNRKSKPNEKSQINKQETVVGQETGSIKANQSKLTNKTVSTGKRNAKSKASKIPDAPKSNSGSGPDHPLLQHSQHRFEANYGIKQQEKSTEESEAAISKVDDFENGNNYHSYASNILPKPLMAQKKSVFTIAYDDIHSSRLKIQDRSTSSPPI